MRSFIQTAALITACGSAVFWFASAMCHLPSVKPSKDQLDKVTELFDRLQRMSTRNFWAAGLMGVTARCPCGLDFSDDSSKATSPLICRCGMRQKLMASACRRLSE
jgi:hypothetical protein